MRLAADLASGKPNEVLRRHVARILASALAAVDPDRAVRKFVRRRTSTLRIGRRSYDLAAMRRILVVGAGKAGAPMAAALESVLGDRIAAGIVNVKYGYTQPLRRVQLIEAGHPLPDESGRRGAEAMLALLAGAGPDDLVICILSGGGSSLLPAPPEPITLQQKVEVTELLLRSGAAIQEINTVRKHLSTIKGGGLARAAAPARVAVIVLSDVIGDPIDAIASGPAAPDPTTFGEALAILERYGLQDRVAPEVRQRLRDGADGRIPETAKPGDPIFTRVQTVIVGSNQSAAVAAVRQATALGYRSLLVTTCLEGEAREAARLLAGIGRSARLAGIPSVPPACVVAGGETTVTVHGTGTGGRCQEFALSAALAVDGWPDVVVAAFGTDGTDGPTDAAGAVADGTTIDRARQAGLNARRALDTNDAYPFFAALGDLIVTGPTNTNVNDLYIVLVGVNREP
ncbi:MAG TPA: glycerate kinase [bacterium]|jgi:hydroxypyruvate reductase